MTVYARLRWYITLYVFTVESSRSDDQEGAFRPRTRGHPPGNTSRAVAVRRRRRAREDAASPQQQLGRDVHVRRRHAAALVRRTALRVGPRRTAYGTRQQQVCNTLCGVYIFFFFFIIKYQRHEGVCSAQDYVA